MKEIRYRGRRIKVREIDSCGGHLDPLHEFADTLLIGDDGCYYLRQERWCKLSPNAENTYFKRIREVVDVNPDPIARKRLVAWRRRFEQPRTTIKRIRERTALGWLIHHKINDTPLKMRMLELVAVAGKLTRGPQSK